LPDFGGQKIGRGQVSRALSEEAKEFKLFPKPTVTPPWQPPPALGASPFILFISERTCETVSAKLQKIFHVDSR
jgi:hypothetical protein